jgi:hypothetical protein
MLLSSLYTHILQIAIAREEKRLSYESLSRILQQKAAPNGAADGFD